MRSPFAVRGVATAGLWAALSAWCMWGFPPCVDLPAHAAQLQTLAGLMRGDPVLTGVYGVHPAIGYGLPYWLFLPVALLTNGAIAARVAMGTALVLTPIAVAALLKALGRPVHAAVLAAPAAFGFTYWYGLLPAFFAQPLLLLALAAFARGQRVEKPWRWWVACSAAATATLLSHVVVFVALALALITWAIAEGPRRWLRPALGVLAIPAVLMIPTFLTAVASVRFGAGEETAYDAMAHVNWFFKNQREEGRLGVAVPLALTAVLLVAWWRRRREEPMGPAAAVFTLMVLYALAPKTLSGSWLFAMRFPALVALVSLAVIDLTRLPRFLRVAAFAASGLALVQALAFHVRFAAAVDGLAQVSAVAPPGRHGYLPLNGTQVLGSRNVYGEHLGQWWTARGGGLGHNFFANSARYPVQFREGAWIPESVAGLAPEQLARFDALLVFGEGPLPTALSTWRIEETSGPWRRITAVR